MISFLKSFLSGDKSTEEKALMAAQKADKERDVMRIDGMEEAEEEQSCAPRGCGGCGCR